MSGDRASIQAGLAANFAAVPMRALEFSTKARVHGDGAMDAWEPQQGAAPDDVSLAVVRGAVAERDGNRCVYCNAQTMTLQLDSINDVHLDVAPDNQVLACPLCHGYHHLGELPSGAGGGRVAYLPGMDASDVNHLQRVLTAELYAGTDETAQDARDLINWLASHSVYVAEAFGTDDPSVFASALRRVDPSWKQRRGVVFENLALVYNPRTMHEHAHIWASELSAAVPAASRARLHHDVLNLHE